MIATFTTFDILSFATPLRRFLPSVAVVVVVAVIAPLPALAIPVAAALMALMAPQTFATDERGRLDTLYAILPISRRTVVAGRYLAVVILYLAMAAVATLAAVAVTLAQGASVPLGQLAVINLVCLVVLLLMISAQLPFFFGLGFARARPMMYLPLVAVSGAVWLAERFALRDAVDLEAVTRLHPAAVAAPLALVVVGAVVLSALLAAGRYEARSL